MIVFRHSAKARRGRPRLCPACGRLIYLNREGLYRRHFAVEPDGRSHLCAASGRESAGDAPGGLHRFDLQ
ncbi:MAG: hypothetical protein WAL31_00860 [Gaiellaceae bacterium]